MKHRFQVNRGLSFQKAALLLLVLAMSAIPSGSTCPSTAVDMSSLNITPILLGVYPEGWIDQSLVDNLLTPFDTWAGKKNSLVGFSSDFEDPVPYLSVHLNALWMNGYTPFINLTVGYFSQPTAYQIAAGQKDDAINHWAQTYASWATGGKFAYIAILPNMNTPWFSYGRDPGNYKLAFVRIRQIFTQNGVPASAVRWVFAPTNQVQLTFESYYPGDDLVDIVGVSAYNDGFCPSTLDPFWDSPQEAFGFALQELHAMAPDKPIFITRLGTTAYTAKKQTNNTAKDQWLRDAYSYVATDPSVRAILYDNYNGSCDWPVFAPGEFQFDGYRDAVADLHYGYLTPARLGETNLDPVIGDKEYYFPFTIATNHQPVLLGTYSQEWIGSQRVMDYEYHALDTWAGKRLSIAGMFLDMFSSPVDNVEMPIEAAWDNGYTPFVNLTVQSNSGITAAKIANGYADAALHDIARTYATMAQYNHQMAFFAPLQEMNGDWVPYSKDPENFKLAYRRIQQIFAEEGVPSNSIKWVFAPSGWSAPESPAFEDYYPGDAYVDVIGFSAYNFGYCPVSQYPKWESPKAIYYKYIERITVLAPGKPIFIAQTGTSAYTSHGKDVAMKNQWLSDAYDYLAAHPSVRAVLYYNRYDDECDFSFYQLGGEQYTGYQQGVANPVYDYISPYALRGMIFAWP